MKRMLQKIKNRPLKIALYALPCAVILGSLVVFVCALIVNDNAQYLYEEPGTHQTKAMLVLGGGIGEKNMPTDVVKSRLDTAAMLYFEGAAEKIIVSGDNRFVDYNEPQVMQDYLQTIYEIPAEFIQQDNAGRSTYESCDRAKHVFRLREVIVVSQRSHLARAIYLCRSFGIETYGFPAIEDHQRASQSFRELAANVKAVYNVYLFGEPTVYGDPIEL